MEATKLSPKERRVKARWLLFSDAEVKLVQWALFQDLDPRGSVDLHNQLCQEAHDAMTERDLWPDG
jgi:hypothetical protein